MSEANKAMVRRIVEDLWHKKTLALIDDSRFAQIWG
jgi:hypothetical protein